MEEAYYKLEKKYQEKCRQIDLMKQIEFVTSRDFNLDSFLERIIDHLLD